MYVREPSVASNHRQFRGESKSLKTKAIVSVRRNGLPLVSPRFVEVRAKAARNSSTQTSYFPAVRLVTAAGRGLKHR